MSSLNPFEPGMCATVLSMTASPKGRSVRIGFRRRHTAHKEYASLSYDEVRNRDIRVGDTVLLIEEATGRYVITRPVLELRPANAEAFV